jgi:hypothetical protein
MSGRRAKVRVLDTKARWHSVPERELKVVATEALRGGRIRQAFYSTDTRQSATTILREYLNRWSIEESHQGSKQHLGFEEPQGWSPQAGVIPILLKRPFGHRRLAAQAEAAWRDSSGC